DRQLLWSILVRRGHLVTLAEDIEPWGRERRFDLVVAGVADGRTCALVRAAIVGPARLVAAVPHDCAADEAIAAGAAALVRKPLDPVDVEARLAMAERALPPPGGELGARLAAAGSRSSPWPVALSFEALVQSSPSTMFVCARSDRGMAVEF